MADTTKISRVSKVTQKILTDSPIGQPTNSDHFESLMNQRRVETSATELDSKDLKSRETNLFDEVRELNQKVDFVTRTSPTELSQQVDDVIAQIDTIKTKLETPGLEVNNSVQRILKNKLDHIDENLKVALDKAGLEYTPPEKPTSLAAPLDKFLGLLTHSQHHLETIGRDITAMQAGGQELSPGNMLLIQIKVGRIQQEIELFTNMLNKSLESTKTIMNVQV